MTTNSNAGMSDPDRESSVSFEDTGHTQCDRGSKKQAREGFFRPMTSETGGDRFDCQFVNQKAH